MQKIVLATYNEGKVKEFEKLLSSLPLNLICLRDLPGIEIIEDGDSFYANAKTKAETVCRLTGLPSLADDSGLVVPYLGGAPGLMSARYAGPQADDEANNHKLLKEMVGVDHGRRQAHFTAVVAWARPRQTTRFASGRCFGFIAPEGRGEQGFGYDPLFYLPQFNKTMAELDPRVKNTISHRAKALRHMLVLLQAEYGPAAL